MKRTVLFPLALISIMAGCDGAGGDPTAPAPTRDLAADEGPNGAMTYFGKKVGVDCDDIAIPPRAKGAPVDDLRGLRLGVPLETAIRFAQCPKGEEVGSVMLEGDGPSLSRDQAGLKIRSFVRLATGVHKPRWGATDVLNYDPRTKLESVDAMWSLYADGMPGQEKLYALWLVLPFAEGSQPTIASQQAALESKYGKPSLTSDRGEMFWLYGPDGKRLPEFDREKLRACSYGIAIYGTRMNWRPDCGLTIVAQVDTAYANPQLAQSVQVAMIDAAAYYDYEVNRFPAERDALRAGQAGAAGANKGAEL
ncbi:MAG: hypothetical protein U1D66_06865 [Erythrobacter sp.]|nr:hypothetical protein [Erythrobacter sp.]